MHTSASVLIHVHILILRPLSLSISLPVAGNPWCVIIINNNYPLIEEPQQGLSGPSNFYMDELSGASSIPNQYPQIAGRIINYVQHSTVIIWFHLTHNF